MRMRIHAFGNKAVEILRVVNSIPEEIRCHMHAFDGFEFVFLQELVALLQRPVVCAQKRHRLNSRHLECFFSFFGFRIQNKKTLTEPRHSDVMDELKRKTLAIVRIP